MAKRIITISREFGSGGRFIGEKVAKKLGIAYYDKNIINDIAEKSGLSPEYVQKNAELSPKKGLFAYAFAGRDITGKSVEDMVYEAQRKVILELADKESCVIIGRNADYILKDKNGYKTRADASSRMSADQISDVALSIEYVKQYTDSHSGISKNHAYLLRQLVVWQRLSVHLGWQCDNVRASYDEIPKATQDEVFSGARAFVKENKGRYECGGYIYSGEGQELGQFWAKLNVGNAKLQKTSSNASITDGNGNYSVAGATYGVFADKDCTKQLATLTTDENGNTDVAEVKSGTVYIKELSAPAGYKVDKTIYPLTIKAGETATLVDWLEHIFTNAVK